MRCLASSTGARFRDLLGHSLRRLSSTCRSLIPKDFTSEVPDTDCDRYSEETPIRGVPRDVSNLIRRLEINQMFANKYRIDSRILPRKGLSRTAVEVATGERVCLDFYKSPDNLERRVDLNNRLNAPKSICRLIEKVDSHARLPMCLVVQRGKYTLDEWLKTPAISLQSRLDALDSIAEVLEELHGLGIVHGDLNPTNLAFFPSGREWKLRNLDSASSTDHEHVADSTDIAYTAPELLDVKTELSDELERDPAVDMWSFGVIAFEVLTGKKFYEGHSLTRESMPKLVTASNVLSRLNAVPDKSQRHFIKKFLKLNPSGRCTAFEARSSSLLKSLNGRDPLIRIDKMESNDEVS